MNLRNSNYIGDLLNIIQYIPNRKLSILVTGATGLIGSCLIDAFCYANDNMNRDYTVYAMGRTLKSLKARFPYTSSHLHFLEQNVQSPLSADLIFDYIVNAASNADPITYALYPAETILTNIIGTKNVLDYALVHPETVILLTSTIEVYGQLNNIDAIPEDAFGLIDFNQTRSGYPESKRTAELLCKSYLEEYGVKVVIARLGYIYGPTMLETDNKVVAQFIRNVLKHENIVLKSKGEQRRSYCYVSDAVAAMCVVLFLGKNGQAYNIASDCSITTIEEMAEIAAKIGGCNITYQSPTVLESKGFSKSIDNILNTNKLQTLGWEPIYDLESGLQQTLDILRDNDFY